MGSKKYSENLLMWSLRWTWYMTICTGREVLGILLHVGRTSAEKSAINAFVGGLWFRILGSNPLISFGSPLVAARRHQFVTHLVTIFFLVIVWNSAAGDLFLFFPSSSCLFFSCPTWFHRALRPNPPTGALWNQVKLSSGVIGFGLWALWNQGSVKPSETKSGGSKFGLRALWNQGTRLHRTPGIVTVFNPFIEHLALWRTLTPCHSVLQRVAVCCSYVQCS